MTSFLASIGYEHWILQVLLGLPLLGMPLILVFPRHMARWIALTVALTELVLGLGIWWAFDPSNPALQFVTDVDWIGRFGIGYRVGIDGLSVLMVLLSVIMMPLVVWGSWRGIDQKQRGFYTLLLALKTGMLGVFVSTDLFLFYFFWELLLIPMYFLIGIWGSNNRLYAATKFVIYTFVGSLLMLVAIVWMVWTVGKGTGTYSFAYEHLLEHAALMQPWAGWLFVAFALAFAVKVPLFPFHTWLPDAHTEAPTAGSVDLAVILLKMGTYGFLRFAIPFFPTFALSETVGLVMATLAVTGIVYAALVAMVQPDLKRLVAYSSVSHLGFVMLGIWGSTVESVQGAILVMVSHGLSTGALFFLIGMLYERRHTRNIADFGGLAKAAPLMAAAFTITAFSSIGLPGLNGFIGEFLVLIGAFGRYPVLVGVATTVVVFSAAYMLWATQRVFFNRMTNPLNEAIGDLTRRELAVLVPLILAMFWIGLYPGPLLRRTEGAARRYIEMVQPHLPAAAMQHPATGAGGSH
ncbi:MAG: NADH-quinone oxidoreductase subunit M [Gemmatimonadales bacterium]|nr:NADH-quinone oxidoreductase subunit M [Gemmatimonadales bacterium]MBA3574709.1 NADH-quinone oxidoreductase subunit M [Pseudonocardiales bacterium]